MRVVMDQRAADIDRRQFVAQVGEAALEKTERQCRLPGPWRRGQHTDTAAKRHRRCVKKVQVGTSVLKREGQGLVEMPQQRVRVLDLSADTMRVANTEALSCVAIATAAFDFITTRYLRVHPRKRNYQGTEGNLH
jgi:hypothetical protein